jgi:LAO/AO transport system kinase
LLTVAEQSPGLVAPLIWGTDNRARVIGITGAPGAGKSTLTAALIDRFRADGRRVGVVAVDPSSPITGGAMLGDRIRMARHTLDVGVFVRSLANRGHPGGLSIAVPLTVRGLELAGFDIVLVETVGVGQVEVEIAGNADLVVVVINPGWGDGIQANKAGILEIADVFVVNKADRPGIQETIAELRGSQTLASAMAPPRWTEAPIVATVATESLGLEELMLALASRFDALHGRPQDAARHRSHQAIRQLETVLRSRVEALRSGGDGAAQLAELATQVAARRLDPWSAADELLRSLT